MPALANLPLRRVKSRDSDERLSILKVFEVVTLTAGPHGFVALLWSLGVYSQFDWGSAMIHER